MGAKWMLTLACVATCFAVSIEQARAEEVPWYLAEGCDQPYAIVLVSSENRPAVGRFCVPAQYESANLTENVVGRIPGYAGCTILLTKELFALHCADEAGEVGALSFPITAATPVNGRTCRYGAGSRTTALFDQYLNLAFELARSLCEPGA